MSKPISNEQVLYVIKTGLTTAFDIGEALACKKTTILYHLRNLKENGLITKNKVGRFTYYHAASDVSDAVLRKQLSEMAIIQRYNLILETLQEPMSVPQLAKELLMDSRGTLTLPVKRLLDEKYLIVCGKDKTSNKYKTFNIYKTVEMPYQVKKEAKILSFESDYLNKMFGVNTIEPTGGRIVKEKNVKHPLKKRSNYGVLASNFDDFI